MNKRMDASRHPTKGLCTPKMKFKLLLASQNEVITYDMFIVIYVSVHGKPSKCLQLTK